MVKKLTITMKNGISDWSQLLSKAVEVVIHSSTSQLILQYQIAYTGKGTVSGCFGEGEECLILNKVDSNSQQSW